MTNTVAASLCATFRELERCNDLRPRPLVSDLFSRLVRLVLDTPDQYAHDVLDDPDVRVLAPRLRRLCARGEYELEYHWAERIGESTRPHAELAQFPYLDNYRMLSRMEIAALTAASARPIRSVAFAGCGPLPMSSLVLAHELGVPVDNLDHDPDAVFAARRVAKVLNLYDLRFHQVDVHDADLSGYDVVILAALVGSTPAEKVALVSRLATSMAPGALLLLRSTRGLRTLLYPEVDVESLRGVDVVTVVHPIDDIINSAVVARAGLEA